MKRILRVLTLLCLIAIPSLVRAAISVSISSTSNTTGCGSVFATFSATTTGCAGTPSYTWYYIKNPAAAGDTVVSSSGSFNFSTIGNYDVAVRSVCGGETAWTVLPNYIHVTDQPVINFSASVPTDPASACPGMVTLTNTSSGDTLCAGHTWRWIINGPVVLPDQLTTNATYNLTTPGDYTITLLYTSSCGCFGNLTRTSYIHISALPVACMTRVDANSTCNAPATVVFSNSCSSNAATYTWTFAGASSTTPSSTTAITSSTVGATYLSPGDYNITMTATNAAGCTTTATPQSIHVGNLTANFLPIPDTVCSGATITLTDATTVDAVAPTTNMFYVNFDPFGTSILVSSPPGPVATVVMDFPSGPGLYGIQDVVTNGNGCQATQTRYVWVRPKPTPFATADTAYKCSAPIVEHFHATPVVSNWTYAWSYGDGATSTFTGAGSAGANPTHTYVTPVYPVTTTQYNVKVIVTDQYSCKDSFSAPLVTIGPPHVTLTALHIDSGCAPIQVCYNISISPLGTPFSVDSVNFGDGTAAGPGTYTDTCHTYTTGNTFKPYVKWRLPSYLGGCSGTDTTRIILGSVKPITHVVTSLVPNGANVDSICPNSTLYFYDTCINCLTTPTYSWSVRTNLLTLAGSTNSTDTVTYPTPSVPVTPPPVDSPWTYTVYTCLNGCCDTFKHRIYVFPPPINNQSLQPVAPPASQRAYYCAHKSKAHFRVFSTTGATSYLWGFGDSPSDTVRTTTDTVSHDYGVSLSTTHIYTVWVEANYSGMAHSCNNSDTFILRLGPIDSTWYLSDTAICVGGSISVHGPFQVNSDTANHNHTPYPLYRYVWGDPGTSLFLPDTLQFHTYTVTGSYVVYPIVQDVYGCPDTASRKTVNVYGPRGGFTASPTTICAGGTVTFTDHNITPGSSIYKRVVWYDYPGTGTLLATTPSPYSFTHSFPEGTHLVALSDTDASPKHCASFDTLTIRSVIPHAYFTTADAVGACAGVSITFRDTNTHVSYFWDFGDGNTLGPSAADSVVTHTYSVNNTYTVSVTVTSDGTGPYPAGCSSIAYSSPITLSNTSGIGIANFGDTSVGCPPLQLAVGPTSTSTSYLYTYAWHMYNADTATYHSTYVFTTLMHSGLHHLTMYATSPRGCVDSASRDYFVGGPIGTLTSSSLTGCAPLTVNVHFDETSGVAPGSTYVWNTCPGGSFSTTTPDITLSYTDTGVFCPPTLFIQNGSCAVPFDNLTDSIRVYATPVDSIHHAARICYGGSDTLRAYNAAHFQWIGPGGTICSDCSFVVVGPLVTTTYTVIGTNNVGCADTDLVVVNVDSPIVVTITGRDSICLGESTTLFATGGSGVFTWVTHPTPTDSSGLSCSVCNPVIVRATSTHTYWAITTNSLGCTDSASHTVVINPLPILHYSPDPAYVCDGSSTVVTVSGAATYLWTPRIGLSCDSCANPTITITDNLIYSVTGTTQYGCRDSITIPVEVYKRNATGTRADTVICAGDHAGLYAYGGLHYIWRPGNSLNDSAVYNPTATPSVTTTYTVYITENVCFKDTQTEKVTVIPIPILHVPPPITIIAGNSVQLYADSLNHVFLTSWEWTPADSTLTCTDCPHPIATPVVTTTYSVSASTIEGCTGHATVTIHLLCESQNQVFIPNTFTPNGDGNNDRFYVSGKGLGLIKRMGIYNRWGELVYEAYDVHPNDPGAGWDGTFRGEVLAPDVYVYVLDILCSTGEPFTFRGDISLVR